MNQLTVVFTDAHINSMEQLANIIAHDWPAIFIKTESEKSTPQIHPSLHYCLDCDNMIVTEALASPIQIGRHRG